MGAIVVGTDRSAVAEQALDVALHEAQLTGDPVRVVHAWTTPVWIGDVPGLGYNPLASPEDSGRLAQELAEEELAKALSRRPAVAQVRATAVGREGRPGVVLTTESAAADLVVVGRHGHGVVSRVLLGSTTSYLLHHARCPVMVVPETVGPVDAVGTVVAGVDGSAGGRAALRWAAAEARRRSWPLVALHSWLLTSLPGRAPMQYVPDLAEYETEAREWLEKELATVLPDRTGLDLRVELSHGSAAWGLLDHTGPEDLLVLGSRGRGGFTGLLLGSVAAQCTEHASGSVVVVRSEQAATAGA
jgi:nucleotide-binding universal stress UspA family protein